MSNKSTNATPNTEADSLRISRVCANRDSFLTVIKPLVKSKQALSDLAS